MKWIEIFVYLNVEHFPLISFSSFCTTAHRNSFITLRRSRLEMGKSCLDGKSFRFLIESKENFENKRNRKCWIRKIHYGFHVCSLVSAFLRFIRSLFLMVYASTGSLLNDDAEKCENIFVPARNQANKWNE